MRKIGLYLLALAFVLGLCSPRAHAAAANVTVTTAVAGVAPTTVTAGGTANINLTVTDTVASSTSNVSIAVVLPAGMTLNGALTTPQSGFTASGTTTITFANAAFTSTSPVTLTIPVKIASSQTTSITIAAPTVTFTDSSTKNPAPTGATVAIAVSADIVVAFTTSPATITAGLTRTCIYTVTNNGPSDAQGVVVMQTKPAGLTSFLLTPTAGAAPNFSNNAGNTISPAQENIPTLAAGAFTQFTFTEGIASSTTVGSLITDAVSSTSTTTDPTASNNTNIQSTAVSNASSDVSVTLTNLAGTTSGQNRSMTVTVANAGPSDAANVVMVKNAAAGTSFVSFVQNTGSSFASSGSPINTWTVASLASGASATFTYTELIASSSTTVTDTATVTVNGNNATDPTPANNTATVGPTALTASADVVVAISNAAGTTAGANRTMTITVSNAGPSDAQSVVMTKNAAVNSTVVSLVQNTGPAATIAANTTATFTTLAAGASATFTYTEKINAGLAVGSTITDTATLTSATGGTVPAHLTSTITAVTTPSADLSLGILASPSPVPLGGTLSYTCTATNNGPDPAASVTFTFPMAPKTYFVSTTTPAGWTRTDSTAVGATGSIVGTIASLPSGGSGIFVITVSTDPTLAIGATLTSIATVSTTSTDPVAANNTNTVSVIVAPPPTISINSINFNEGNSGTSLATFTLTLSVPAAQAQVDFKTVDGSAKAPTDYISQVGTAFFLPNSTTTTFTVPIVGNTLVESDKTFTVHLSNPSAGTVIGTNDGVCTIKNDDLGGALQFSKAAYTVNENAGTATITVTRTGGAASNVTVAYATSDATGLAGTDYTAANGTLTFNANATSQTFTIPLLNKYGAIPDATVNLTLSNASSGAVIVPGASATLGAQSTATLTILAAPAFTSALSVSAPVGAQFAYALSATGESPIAFAVTNAAALPPGLSYSAGFITGTPTFVGSFAVPITATNAVGTDSQTLVLNITGLSLPTGATPSQLDSDGDGFPDQLEIAAGSNPFDAKSTPISNTPAQVLAISSVKLGIGLNFAKHGHDAVVLSGAVTLPAGFAQSGKLVFFDIGGVIRRFALDANGMAKIGSDSVKFRFGTTIFSQVGTFTLTIKKADAVALLTQEGLTNGDFTAAPRVMPVFLMLNTNLYKIMQPQLYTAKTGRTGKTKNP